MDNTITSLCSKLIAVINQLIKFLCKNFITDFVLNNLIIFSGSCNHRELFASVIKNPSLVRI